MALDMFLNPGRRNSSQESSILPVASPHPNPAVTFDKILSPNGRDGSTRATHDTTTEDACTPATYFLGSFGKDTHCVDHGRDISISIYNYGTLTCGDMVEKIEKDGTTGTFTNRKLHGDRVRFDIRAIEPLTAEDFESLKLWRTQGTDRLYGIALSDISGWRLWHLQAKKGDLAYNVRWCNYISDHPTIHPKGPSDSKPQPGVRYCHGETADGRSGWFPKSAIRLTSLITELPSEPQIKEQSEHAERVVGRRPRKKLRQICTKMSTTPWRGHACTMSGVLSGPRKAIFCAMCIIARRLRRSWQARKILRGSGWPSHEFTSSPYS